jgi:UDP-N-acetylglucosamine--N-acetylmuramyl-(pentapeptide) pyrophosphoryl-undecaprenol N-acetylglucosamine transferase
MKKYIIISSSGTGGHIYPAILLAEEFKEVGYNIVFFINITSISLEIIKKYNFEYILFNIPEIQYKNPFLFILFFFKIIFVFFKSLTKILFLNPHFLINTGGFISIPVVFAAKIFNKKIFTHEQNVIPGKANIFLSKLSNKIFINFKKTEKFFNKKKSFVFGCPIRKCMVNISKKKAIEDLKLKNNLFTILIFGGSLGSKKINEITCKTIIELFNEFEFQVLHITGINFFRDVKKTAKGLKNYKIFDYMHDISKAYAVSDIIICRSGACTVSEIKYLNKSSILIPYKHATDNHQYWNAKEIEKKNKTIIIEEKNFNEEELKKSICFLFLNLKKFVDKNIVNFNTLPQKLIFKEIMKTIN